MLPRGYIITVKSETPADLYLCTCIVQAGAVLTLLHLCTGPEGPLPAPPGGVSSSSATAAGYDGVGSSGTDGLKGATATVIEEAGEGE